MDVESTNTHHPRSSGESGFPKTAAPRKEADQFGASDFDSLSRFCSNREKQPLLRAFSLQPERDERRALDSSIRCRPYRLFRRSRWRGTALLIASLATLLILKETVVVVSSLTTLPCILPYKKSKDALRSPNFAHPRCRCKYRRPFCLSAFNTRAGLGTTHMELWKEDPCTSKANWNG